jgi:hypothetical protein
MGVVAMLETHPHPNLPPEGEGTSRGIVQPMLDISLNRTRPHLRAGMYPILMRTLLCLPAAEALIRPNLFETKYLQKHCG